MYKENLPTHNISDRVSIIILCYLTLSLFCLKIIVNTEIKKVFKIYE